MPLIISGAHISGATISGDTISGGTINGGIISGGDSPSRSFGHPRHPTTTFSTNGIGRVSESNTNVQVTATPTSDDGMPVAASLTSSTLSSITATNNSSSLPFTSESTSITMYTRPTMQSTGTTHHMSSGIIGGITAGVVLLLSLLVVVALLIIRRRIRRGITTGVSDETIARPYDMAGGDIEKSGNATGSDAALHPSTFTSVTIAPQAKREHQNQQSNPILNDQRLNIRTTSLPELEMLGGDARAVEQSGSPGPSTQAVDANIRPTADPSGNEPAVTVEVTTLPGIVERLNRAIRLLESRPGISTNVEEQPPRYEE